MVKNPLVWAPSLAKDGRQDDTWRKLVWERFMELEGGNWLLQNRVEFEEIKPFNE